MIRLVADIEKGMKLAREHAAAGRVEDAIREQTDARHLARRVERLGDVAPHTSI